MMTRNTNTGKAQQRVTVRPADIHQGIYAALSTDGVSWYRVDVRAQTCNCAAGVNGFRHTKLGMCRHVVAARTWARALASMTPADRERALRLQNVRIDVAAVDVARLDAPLARPVQKTAQTWSGAVGLMEAFGLCATEPT